MCAEVLAVDTLRHVIRAEPTLSHFKYHKELCAEVIAVGILRHVIRVELFFCNVQFYMLIVCRGIM